MQRTVSWKMVSFFDFLKNHCIELLIFYRCFLLKISKMQKK